jgi:hypothetical protein
MGDSHLQHFYHLREKDWSENATDSQFSRIRGAKLKKFANHSRIRRGGSSGNKPDDRRSSLEILYEGQSSATKPGYSWSLLTAES